MEMVSVEIMVMMAVVVITKMTMKYFSNRLYLDVLSKTWGLGGGVYNYRGRMGSRKNRGRGGETEEKCKKKSGKHIF